MLISDSKNFLFYHVYKVAGTSVRSALRPYCAKKQIVLQNYYYALKLLGVHKNTPVLYQFHPNLVDVKKELGNRYEQYYKFAFVRHPLDWQKSLYFFMLRNRLHWQHKIVREMDFERYLIWRMKSDRMYMTDILHDDKGKLLVNDFFKFENIAQDFPKICERLKIDAKLPHKNKAGYGRKIDISEEILVQFKEVYEIDYTNFDYK